MIEAVDLTNVEGVVLGYGDVVQIASECDGTGTPIWRKAEVNSYPAPFEALFVAESGTQANPPSNAVTMGILSLRTDQDGYLDPSLHWLDMGTTRSGLVAVRVLGTLAASDVRELAKNGSVPPRKSVSDPIIIPDHYEGARAVFSGDSTMELFSPNLPRSPAHYAIRADLSRVPDPIPYMTEEVKAEYLAYLASQEAR